MKKSLHKKGSFVLRREANVSHSLNRMCKVLIDETTFSACFRNTLGQKSGEKGTLVLESEKLNVSSCFLPLTIYHVYMQALRL